MVPPVYIPSAFPYIIAMETCPFIDDKNDDLPPKDGDCPVQYKYDAYYT